MIEIAEYSSASCALPPVSLEDEARISGALGNRLSVTWLSGGRVDVRASHWVGSLDVTPDLRVRIVPKLAGRALGVLTMLAVTDGSPVHELPRFFRGLSDDSAEDAIQLLCRLVVTHTERLMARGLVRNYRSHSGDLPFLRGKLDVYRQATVHYGTFASLACSFDEFDHDTIENHLLLAGVRIARRATVDPHVRLRAAELEARLRDIAPTLPSTRVLLASTIVYGRRTAHYRGAHTWCRSLLGLARVDDVGRESAARIDSFLIDMNALFERFVEWLIGRVFAGTGMNVQAQKRNPSFITVDGRSRRAIASDLVVSNGTRQAALDAKYKLYDTTDISPSDIYQLLLYAQCHTGFSEVPTSYLLFPTAGASMTESTVELTVPGEGSAHRVRIRALGIPLAAILAGLRSGNRDSLDGTVAALCRVLPRVANV